MLIILLKATEILLAFIASGLKVHHQEMVDWHWKVTVNENQWEDGGRRHS